MDLPSFSPSNFGMNSSDVPKPAAPIPNVKSNRNIGTVSQDSPVNTCMNVSLSMTSALVSEQIPVDR